MSNDDRPTSLVPVGANALRPRERGGVFPAPVTEKGLSKREREAVAEARYQLGVIKSEAAVGKVLIDEIAQTHEHGLTAKLASRERQLDIGRSFIHSEDDVPFVLATVSRSVEDTERDIRAAVQGTVQKMARTYEHEIYQEARNESFWEKWW